MTEISGKTDGIFVKILSLMGLWTRKFPSSFEGYLDMICLGGSESSLFSNKSAQLLMSACNDRPVDRSTFVT